MSTEQYKVAPGDLITAKLFNGLQDQIGKDITDQVTGAINAIKHVPQSGDADKFGNLSPEEWEKKIIDRALAEIPKRTGYRMIFKILKEGVEETIQHDLKAFPLVDAYQLDYFEVVCADGDEKDDRHDQFVNFYLYHTSETELKPITANPTRKKIIIEPSDDDHFNFKIPFEEMLKLYGVEYTSSQSLGDIVVEFWDKFFTKPNDRFDPDQYCHSPWFEKCCGENRSYAMLKQRGNWDEIWFQMRARKTINFPAPSVANETPQLFPNNLEVVHLNFNQIGVKLRKRPFFPAAPPPPPDINQDELKIMLLLKV